jgi:hypothetical protein
MQLLTSTPPAPTRWFNSTLSSLNRTVYPWVVVAHHVPLYTTLPGHYHEIECFRCAAL